MLLPCSRCGSLDQTKCGCFYQMQTQDFGEEFFGGSPNIFVGRIGYPYLNVGILAPPGVKESQEYDAPRMWSEQNYQIAPIAALRNGLVNSRFKVGVMEQNKFVEISQEIGMASRPVDVEINLEKKPSQQTLRSQDVQPMGPAGMLHKAMITSNPSIDTRVDKVVSDTDRKAIDGIEYLYTKKFDEHFLTKLLSIGTLGVKSSRKIVPTRWSITAVDDQIGKLLVNEVKDFSNRIDYHAYFGGYLGNYFLILTFPEVWSYELFEMYTPRPGMVTTDYEPNSGRKTYAENTAGGYYANRLPIVEKLKNMKRQGCVLALRFITEEYTQPLGVWVVREATRKALNAKPIEFATKDLMINYAKLLAKRKFNYDVNPVLQQSIMLKNMKEQSKLASFF